MVLSIFIGLCNHHYYLITYFHYSRKKLRIYKQSFPILPCLQSLKITNILCFCRSAYSGHFIYVMPYADFSVCFLSLSMMFQGFIYAVASSALHSFSWSNYVLLYGYTFCLSIMSIWVASAFWLLWLMLLWISCTSFWLDISLQFPWVCNYSGISGSYSKSMFNQLRNCQTVLQSSCTIL